MFRTFRGYTDSDEIVQVLPEKFDPNKERAGTMSNETLAVVTPNVARVVREHFACNTLAGAELEDDGGPGSAYAHWEERIFQVPRLAKTPFFPVFSPIPTYPIRLAN